MIEYSKLIKVWRLPNTVQGKRYEIQTVICFISTILKVKYVHVRTETLTDRYITWLF